MFPKAAKNYAQQLNVKIVDFKIAPKVIKYLANLCTVICHQELSKTAQSGQTVTKTRNAGSL